MKFWTKSSKLRFGLQLKARFVTWFGLRGWVWWEGDFFHTVKSCSSSCLKEMAECSLAKGFSIMSVGSVITIVSLGSEVSGVSIPDWSASHWPAVPPLQALAAWTFLRFFLKQILQKWWISFSLCVQLLKANFCQSQIYNNYWHMQLWQIKVLNAS